MQSIIKSAACGLVVGCVALGAPAQATTLAGNTATLEWGTLASSPWQLASLSPTTTGSNPGFVNTFGATVIGSASPTFADPALGVNVNVVGNQVIVSESAASTSFATLAFNGFVLRDLTNPFTSAALVTASVPGFSAADVGVIAGDLWVNFAGLTIGSGTEVTLNMNGAAQPAVPEAATWMMAIAGFAALGVVLRRERARVVFG
ncbi:MAG: hypothetical protein KGK11_00345 [Sphingomonadales bacterium]|nr:hypothetical protein [Sphingomonadales bacterium]